MALRALAERSWSFLRNDAECRQEIEQSNAPWTRTWKHFALRIIEALLRLRDALRSRVSSNKHFSADADDDERFWSELSLQFLSLRKDWNERVQSLEGHKEPNQP